MRILSQFGIDPCSPDISCEFPGPCFGASVPRMVVAESTFCLQLHFEYRWCAPLVQQNLPAKSDLENCYSFNVVFSSDRSGDRFTGKPVSQTTGLYYEYSRWYDASTGRFIPLDLGRYQLRIVSNEEHSGMGSNASSNPHFQPRFNRKRGASYFASRAGGGREDSSTDPIQT